MRNRGLTLAMLATLCTLAGGGTAMAGTGHAFSGAFGEAGHGNGQFEGPAGVAISQSSGDVYVLDSGNNRVEVFEEGGAYLSQFAPPAGAFSGAAGIAVDNSANPLDPSAGDVYLIDTLEPEHDVVDKFSAAGAYLGQLTEAEAGHPLGVLDGVAVDPEGALWIYQQSGEIDEFSDAAANAFTSLRPSPFGTSPGFAVDAEDSLYVNRGSEIVAKLDSEGTALIEEIGGQSTSAAAVDPSSGEVYLDNRTLITGFESTGAQLESFGSGHLTSGGGLAVNATGTVYVADAAADDVEIFPRVVTPDVGTEAPTGIGQRSVTFNGTVNPNGVQVSKCQFEYGSVGEPHSHIAACATSPGSGSGSVPVTANVTGLQPNTTYYFRLFAENTSGGTGASTDQTLFTGGPPAIDEQAAASVEAESAVLRARINPFGHPGASYRFEYGTSTAYGTSVPVPDGPLAATAGDITVSQTIAHLQPNTTYHYRVTASDGFEAVSGPDETFTTTTLTPAGGLPDGRVEELVTPVDNSDADIYVPDIQGIKQAVEGGYIESNLSFEASRSGNAVTYAGDPTPGGTGAAGGAILGDQFLATRTSSGWTQQNISPHGRPKAVYEAFSPDLSSAVLRAGGNYLEKSALLPEAPAGYRVLYSRQNDSAELRALFTSFVGAQPEELNDRFAGGTESFTTMLFEATASLVAGAPAGNDLYEQRGGALALVNVLPDGTPEPASSFGGPNVTDGEGTRDYSHDISADGTRVFWTGLASHGLYLHEDGAPTVQLDASQAGGPGGGGLFWTASTDGSKVFFTDQATAGLTSDTVPGSGANLYEYDLDTHHLSDLTAASEAEVQGVVGASANGDAVYFVADGVLAPGAHAGGCEQGGSPSLTCNLYIHKDGVTRYIATLLLNDGVEPTAGSIGYRGDWVQGMGGKMAEATPSGESLIFESHEQLTAYDNQGLREAYVYNSSSGEIQCASCDPTGAALPASAVAEGALIAGVLPTGVSEGDASEEGQHMTYTPTWISADGNKAFFDSYVPLVPQDTNGQIDVYEWERYESGGCSTPTGCVHLLSGGKSNSSSYLIGMSENASDVFFVTRAKLTEADSNETTDVYDARENGVQSVSPPVCSGAGCQGVPPTAPTFATPASATFNGVGNFGPAPAVKPKVRTLSQAQKLAKALKACRKQPKRRRARCEAAAHRHYPTASKSKRTTRQTTKAKSTARKGN
jgi:NHL repeat